MLPLLFGLGGSALAGAGMLGGMSALTAGAWLRLRLSGAR